MKLRIRGNSIRFRVSRSELDRLVWTGVVEDAMRFGPARDQRMIYALRRDNYATSLNVDFTPGRILVHIPPAMINRWLNPDQVGISGAHDIGAGDELSILLEKDFACSERADVEENADTFPRSHRA